MILTSAYFAICKTTTKLMSELCIIHLCKVCMYKKITLFHVFFCLHVCMPACLPSCLSAVSTCQPACLPVYQLFLPVSLPSCLSAVSTCQPACLPVYQLFLPVSLPSCLSAVSTCQPACLPVYQLFVCHLVYQLFLPAAFFATCGSDFLPAWFTVRSSLFSFCLPGKVQYTSPVFINRFNIYLTFLMSSTVQYMYITFVTMTDEKPVHDIICLTYCMWRWQTRSLSMTSSV